MLKDLLPPFDQKSAMITVVGAGGKTSFIQWLATYYSALGHKVLIAPSTKICVQGSPHVLLENQCADLEESIRKSFTQNNIVTVCAQLDDQKKKYVGLNQEQICALKNMQLAEIILCEGDGAARKPLKAPAAHEPVIPDNTDFCVGIIGLDVLYKPLSTENVHRAELFSKLTSLPLEQEIHFKHFVSLVNSENGLFKNCPQDLPRIVFLNKFDMVQDATLPPFWHQELLQFSQQVPWYYGSTHKKEIWLLS